VNITGFDIQRSADGRSFKNIGYSVPIAANGISTKKNYSFVDNSPLSSTNYYRLAIKELNGSTTYSKVLAIRNSNAGQELAVFPNPLPVNGALTVQLPAGLKGRTSLQISDAMGRIVRSMTFQTNGYALATTVDVSSLNKGVYIIRAKTEEGKTLTTRFVKD
jgi:hypothetical protein